MPLSAFGIMHSDAKRRIFRFEENPRIQKLLDELQIPPELLKELNLPETLNLSGLYGYLRIQSANSHRFDLNNDFDDFGKHVIPRLASELQGGRLIFQGYWERHRNHRCVF